MERKAIVERKTFETDIKISLFLDGEGKSEISTGVGFLDHMLTLFAKHGLFDLSVTCKGDTYVDFHHSTEDIGISLGEAFAEALGDKKGIKRYGSMLLPMDEALVLSAVDLSGRSHLSFDASFKSEKIGDFDSELVEEFFLGFVRSAGATLHIREMAGNNSHHLAEAMFKSAARSLREAVSPDERNRDSVPSTKGVL